MQATARMASVVSSALPARRRLIREVESVKELRMGRFAQSLMLLLAILLSTGCSPARPSKTQVVGTWKAQHNFGTETLTISTDGTFTQRLVEKNGRSSQNQGHWELVPVAEKFSGSQVLLHEALVFSSPFGERELDPHRTDWKLEALYEWGRLILCFNPDLPGFHKE